MLVGTYRVPPPATQVILKNILDNLLVSIRQRTIIAAYSTNGVFIKLEVEHGD